MRLVWLNLGVIFFATGLGAVPLKVSIFSIFQPRLVRVYTQEQAVPDEIQLEQGKLLQVNDQQRNYYAVKSAYPITVEIPGRIKRRFAGSIWIYPTKKKLLIINRIQSEQYLESVVYSEMGKSPFAMYQVQAVLARTKALEKYQERNHQSFMLTDLTDSQAYKGLDHTTDLVKKAVLTTRNLILSYSGELAKIYYASTCAGHTSTPEAVWGSYEAGFKPVKCQWQGKILCRHSPHYQPWQWRVTRTQLQKILGAKHLVRVSVAKRDKSQKSQWLKIEAEREYRLRAENFRIKVGRFFKKWSLLKSNFFSIKQNGHLFIFTGRGLGHGVGLCQWGARNLAKQGWSYQRILKFYFPLLNIKNYQQVGFYEN